MASLESKLLDGKCAGYCSSSEDEEEVGFRAVKDDDEHEARVMRGVGGNTGPKGVLNDFKEFREQHARELREREREVIAEAKKGMLSGREEEREQEEPGDEDELALLRKRRLEERKRELQGKIIELREKNNFLEAIEGAGESLLFIAIYEPNVDGCEQLSRVLRILAASHPSVRFTRIRSAVLQTSAEFKEGALPTLQVYFKGELVGNFVRITRDLGLDFDQHSIDLFLRRHNIRLDLNRVVDSDEELSD